MPALTLSLGLFESLNWTAVWEDGVVLAVVGFAVVFTALSLVAVFIALLNAFDRRFGLGAIEPEPAPATGMDDAHLQVILAAAATAVLRRRVAIQSFEKKADS